MKSFLILALVGLGAAAPANITRPISTGPVSTEEIAQGSTAKHVPQILRHPFEMCFLNKNDECILPIDVEASIDTAFDAKSLNEVVESSPDADLEEFETDPSYSQFAHEETAFYPFELVVEDYNNTAIHQAIAIHSHDDYDATECAMHCVVHRACDAFAIYVEREPSCTDCSNPEALAVNKCALFNTLLKKSDIKKEIETQEVQGKTFTHAIRAYNGYNRIQKPAAVTAARTVTVTVTTTAHPAAFTIYHS